MGPARVRGAAATLHTSGITTISTADQAARGFYAVIIGSMVLGLALDLGGLDPIRGLYYAAILNGLAVPPLVIVMFVLARSRRTLAEHRSRRISSTLVIATIMASVALPIAYLLR